MTIERSEQTSTPALRILRRQASPSRLAPTLIVLLPGAYMTPEHFIEAGFDAALAARGIDADLALPAIDFARLSDGSALPALHEEIILPARRDGYCQVWLGGISLGAFGALDYMACHGAQIDGLCLFAPYPGSRISLAEISAAGGLAAWQPSPEQLFDADFRIWHWLKAPPAELPIHFAFGSEDRFAAAMDLMAKVLPGATVHRVPGGHDWPVWRCLWQAFLDHNPFTQAPCPAPGSPAPHCN